MECYVCRGRCSWLGEIISKPLGDILEATSLVLFRAHVSPLFDGYPTLELWDISSNSWSSTALRHEPSLVPSSESPLTQIDIDTPGYITRTRSFPYWDRVFLDDVVFPYRLPSYHGGILDVPGILWAFVYLRY